MAMEKFKPHLLMILVQICYSFLYFITEASFNHGMNPHVYVTYRNIVGGLVMLPFAYFLERKKRPKLTMALLLEFFVLSLMGVSLALNMYFVSLTFISPTFIASMLNTIAALTFVLAVILRLEIVNFKDPRGIAKIIGTLISLAGVMIMTLYKGAILKNLWHPIIYIHQGNNVVKEDWVKGSILTVASCITWAIWYIMQKIANSKVEFLSMFLDCVEVIKGWLDKSWTMSSGPILGRDRLTFLELEDNLRVQLNQAYTLKRYPAQLSLTTWMSFVGAAQSAFYTVIVQHKRAAWTIGFNIDFWSTIYGGIVISGLVGYIQLWCTEQKGPVFVTMFNPLSTILVALLAYFVFGEKLYMGSIIGAIIVIVGLYLLLWGKEDPKSERKDEEKCCTTKIELHHEDNMMQKFTSDANPKDTKNQNNKNKDKNSWNGTRGSNMN
ncbi:hypothetical protein RDI58_006667 [Solanum bulbocastanum]|uniref:EamA domain-containing protein n=1 Tax=Solanum bulbocastanum TaxID=147425 RepID=A0AAN8TT23_SOLBU